MVDYLLLIINKSNIQLHTSHNFNSIRISSMGLFFFQEKMCTVCDTEFDGVDDIVYTYMTCLHPVCRGCASSKCDFYEFCGDCEVCVATTFAPSDITLEADEEFEGPFHYGIPEECKKMVLPKKIRCVSKKNKRSRICE